MVVEDYPPFLISGIYLQDVDLIDYPHHGPLGFFFFFLGRRSRPGCFIGPTSLLGPSGWAYE